MWDIDHPKAQLITHRIAEMICVDNQPTTLVEDVGFIRLMEVSCPNYQIPSRKYIKDKIIRGKIYKSIESQIKEHLNDVPYLSLTSDIWTADTNGTPFISLTVHWLTENFIQQHMVLAVKPFVESHTGDNIAEFFLLTLEHYGISTSKVHLVLRDAASNIVLGTRVAELPSLNCYIHQLSLIVNESVYSQRAISDIIRKNRQIVAHFKRSCPARQLLLQNQKQFNLPERKLIQDNNTRWNSTHDMLHLNTKQKQALSACALQASDFPNLTPHEWILAGKAIALLKPFKQVTVKFSAWASTTADIIPSILALRLFIEKADSNDFFNGIKTTVGEMKDSISKRLAPLLTDRLLVVSTFLDPRYKNQFQSSEINIDTINNWVYDAYLNIDNAHDSSSSSNEEQPSTTDNTGGEDAGSAPFNLDDCFTELASSSRSSDAVFSDVPTITTSQRGRAVARPAGNDNQAIRTTRRAVKIQSEIHDYLALPLLKNDKCPFEWWRSIGSDHKFKNLAKLARRFLSAPSSSIESERLFSTGGNIYEPTRNRLCPKNAEMLLFLHYNLRSLNFKY